MSTPTPPTLQERLKIGTDRVNESLAQARASLSHQHIAMYVSQKPSILGTVDPEVLEKKAGEKLDKDNDGAYWYVFGSAGQSKTTQANRAAFDKYRIIPKMLVDNTVRDLSTTLFGVKYPSPIILAPVGVQALMHQDAELATARAAAKCNIPFCLSTAATRTMEEVAKESGNGPRWYQLYWPKTEDVTLSLLNRAKASGYTALIITLDTMLLGWRPADLARAYLPFTHGVGCQQGFSDPVFMAKAGLPPTHAHPVYPYDPNRINKIIEDESDQSEEALKLKGERLLSIKWMNEEINSGWFPSWENLAFIRKNWEGPIILKGIQDTGDAERAIESGIDGIVVSNHGGRQVDGAIASLDALELIMKSAKVKEAQSSGKFTVLFDSGIRSGPDILKALALGAQGVMIARLYMYALALEGEAGVEAVIKQLLSDFSITMGLAGYKNIEEVRQGLGAQLQKI